MRASARRHTLPAAPRLRVVLGLGLCLESWVVAVKALAKAAFTKTMKAPLMVGNIFVNSFSMLIQQQICLFKKKPEFLPFF